MLLKVCMKCEHLIPIADGHSVTGKCAKENLFSVHTHCIREKALKMYIEMYKDDGPAGLWPDVPYHRGSP